VARAAPSPLPPSGQAWGLGSVKAVRSTPAGLGFDRAGAPCY